MNYRRVYKLKICNPLKTSTTNWSNDFNKFHVCGINISFSAILLYDEGYLGGPSMSIQMFTKENRGHPVLLPITIL